MLCQEETDITYGPEVKLTDAVSNYFSPDGPLHECSFKRLEELATKVYMRYMSTSAAEDAAGHSLRDPEIYGTAWTTPDEVQLPEPEDKNGG